MRLIIDAHEQKNNKKKSKENIQFFDKIGQNVQNVLLKYSK